MAAKKGLRDERLVKEIQERGSKALPPTNSSGVRLSKKAKPSDEKPAPPIGAAQIRPVEKVQPTLDTPNFGVVDNIKNDPLYGYISEKEIDGGIISGQLIRPKYNTNELKKSIDTEIFELLPNTPAPQPDTVLRSVYNVATQSIVDLTADVQRLNFEVNDLSAKISELEIVSESLKIEADNQLLRANIAEDTATVANTQVAVTTVDLQNAIQNSINEAVQRVSLTARIEALQESFRVQKGLTIQREKEQAAQTAIEGLNGFFEQTENSGWKIAPSLIESETAFGLLIKTYRDNKFNMINGPRVTFYNFSDEEQTFTISGYPVWLEGPAPFKVPPRVEGTAGVTTVQFKWKNYEIGKSDQKDRGVTYSRNLTINTTSGDRLTLPVKYYKKVRRKDTWGSRYAVNTWVGQDTSAASDIKREGD